LDAERNLWHLFRPNHQFRENFSTVPDEILEPLVDRFEGRTSALHFSLGVEPRESEEHLKRFDATVRVSGEVAGGALGGDFDYDRWQFTVKGEWNSDEVHRLSARLWYGKGRRDLPPNKLFYLGGIGSLPGYPQKSLVGSQAMVATFEYRFDYWPNQMFDGGILLFVDVGHATFDDKLLELGDFKSDIGVGFAAGESVRLNVAKGLDTTDRDIRISLSLWQKF
jgi:outer membrane translocation and assembly module TamA